MADKKRLLVLFVFTLLYLFAIFSLLRNDLNHSGFFLIFAVIFSIVIHFLPNSDGEKLNLLSNFLLVAVTFAYLNATNRIVINSTPQKPFLVLNKVFIDGNEIVAGAKEIIRPSATSSIEIEIINIGGEKVKSGLVHIYLGSDSREETIAISLDPIVPNAAKRYFLDSRLKEIVLAPSDVKFISCKTICSIPESEDMNLNLGRRIYLGR